MWLSSLLMRWASKRRRSLPSGVRRGPRLAVEQLEGRLVPATWTAASVGDLVSDIHAANQQGGNNTIILAPQTTFTLTAADNGTDGGNGLPVIAAGDNLTIVGNHDTIQRSTAAGTAAFRLFDVAKGGSLALQDLTLLNGLTAPSVALVPITGNGGAVANQGTLSLTDCIFSGNSADQFGGAVANSGQATIEQCTFSGCSATFGGAIANLSGNLLIESSTVSGCSAFQGGGILINAGRVQIEGSTVMDNSSGGGGGIANSYGAVSIRDSVLFGNFSDDFGGCLTNGGTMTISDSTLSDNSAAFGGAIGNAGNLTIDHSTLTGNSADLWGGAIYQDLFFGTLTINQSSLSDNTAFIGGGIYITGEGYSLNTVTINQSTLSGNTAQEAGGAVVIDGPRTLVIKQSVLSGNSAGDGGGILNNGGTVSLDNSTDCGNTAPVGADLDNAGSATLINSDVCDIVNTGQLTTK